MSNDKPRIPKQLKSIRSIEREKRRLRAFIDAHVGDPARARDVSLAYGAECALTWVVGPTSWTPSSLVADKEHTK